MTADPPVRNTSLHLPTGNSLPAARSQRAKRSQAWAKPITASCCRRPFRQHAAPERAFQAFISVWTFNRSLKHAIRSQNRSRNPLILRIPFEGALPFSANGKSHRTQRRACQAPSEEKLQSKLNNPGIPRRNYGSKGCALIAAIRPCGEAAVRKAQIHVVQPIERFSSELKSDLFR